MIDMHKDALIKELLEALKGLYDVQNLEQYCKERDKAMMKARVAIFWGERPEDFEKTLKMKGE